MLLNNFITNDRGIVIKKCCASCIHMEPENEFRRKCKIGEGSVRPSGLCSDWAMRENLRNAGKGDGKIKKKRYLKYVHDYVHPTPPAEPVSINTIRREYEEEYGSIYLNF